jgi:hypothetical protein
MSPEAEFLEAVKRGDASAIADLLRGHVELADFLDRS